MYIRKRFTIKEMILWTRKETLVFILIATIPAILYEWLDLKWLQLPWLPIALIGTAVAFIIGFQNSAAYDRAWEARKIWGGIVNTSRSFAVLMRDTVTNEHAKQPENENAIHAYRRQFVDQHIAWMTALRYAMRQPRPWEVVNELETNREWTDRIIIPEFKTSLEEALKPLLHADDYSYIMGKTNKATAMLALQSKMLRNLKEKGLIWEFSFLELEGLIKELFDLQGKSERIKNFPYPRQYASLNNYFVRIFIVLIPFGVIPEFA